MEQLRVNRGIEIGVNDNGDSIFIDAENTLWVKSYKTLVTDIQKIADEVNAIDDSNLTEDEQLDIIIEKMRKVMDAIDRKFGENTCLKVFGDIVPSPMAVVEFFDLLNPIVEKYAKARNEKISAKYSKARKGGK